MHSQASHTTQGQSPQDAPSGGACFIADTRNETIRIGIVAGEASLVANANSAAVFEDRALAEQFLRDLPEQSRWVIRSAHGRSPSVTWAQTRTSLGGTAKEAN